MNPVLINVFTAIGAILIGYFLGGIPFGVIIGKTFFHKDPRDYGSHNSGGTNSGRVFGAKIGILVIALDMLKTAIVIYVIWAIVTFTPLSTYYVWGNGFDSKPFFYWLGAFASAVGHCYSIYIDFKGGKAVACFMGMCIFTSWLGLIVALFFFLVVAIQKYVSLSSLISGLLEVIVIWFVVLTGYYFGFETTKVMWTSSISNGLVPDVFCGVFLTLSYLVLVYRHKSNIKRIANGTESRLY